MLRIPFEWFEFRLKCFESGSNLHSNASKFHSNASNPFRVVRILIRIDQIFSNGSNLDSNASNPFEVVRICDWNALNLLNGWIRIRMLQIPFK